MTGDISGDGPVILGGIKGGQTDDIGGGDGQVTSKEVDRGSGQLTLKRHQYDIERNHIKSIDQLYHGENK